MNLKELLDNNISWATRMKASDPEFFSRLEHIQKPKYLWIGCSDSRVPANQITGLAPGEVFVHRNIANMVLHTDFNCLSVIQYALDVLKIEHIIVCGHYGCSGIKAAVDRNSIGFVENWLRHIHDIQTMHRYEINDQDDELRYNQLTEWNIKHQVLHVAECEFMTKAWERGQKVAVHGWVYALSNGLIQDLNVTVESQSDANILRAQIFGDHLCTPRKD